MNAIVDKAIKRPHDYVLKPQKEGGGNNFYDKELKTKLILAKKSLSEDDALRTYLVMERINPPMIPAVMMRNGETKVVNSLSEFGIYSCIFIDTQNNEVPLAGIPKSRNLGTLMRTKASHVNEGGVNAGFAVIDSPYVVKADVFRKK